MIMQDTPSEYDDLVVLRRTLFAHLEIAEPSVSAQIAGRLQAVVARLAELSKDQEVTLDDALAERRARRTNAAVASTGRSAKRPG
jgi:hypothetical protein